MRFVPFIVAAAFAFHLSVASASVSAIPEDLLCQSSHVVTGTVMAVTLKPNDFVDLSVMVSKTLGIKKNEIDVLMLAHGNTIYVTTRLFELRPQDLELQGQATIISSLERPITQGKAEAMFLGKEFLFEISRRINADHFDSYLLPAERADWVASHLAHGDGVYCPKIPG